MALLWMDGYDHYDSITYKYWSWSGGTVVWSGDHRTGTRCCNNGYGLLQLKTVTTARMTCGFAWRNSSLGGGCGFYGSDGTTQLMVHVNDSGGFNVYRGGSATAWQSPLTTTGATLLGSTAAGIVNANTWYYIEVQAHIRNATGSVLIHVNGVNVPTTPDLSTGSIDTCYTQENCFGFAVAALANGITDDVYVLDNSGSVNTTFLGDTRIDAHYPVTPNGTDTGFSRSTGSDDWAILDETPANTTDYIYADAVGEKTSVHVTPLINTGGTISGVQVSAFATKNDAGPCGFKIYLLSNSTRYYSEEFFPSYGSWKLFTWRWEQHPYPSDEAWTEADYNACEFGVERTT